MSPRSSSAATASTRSTEGTGRRRPRPHPVLRRVRRPGRRHRLPRRSRRARSGSSTPSTRCPASSSTRAEVVDGEVREGDDRHRPHRRRPAATGSAATTPPPTSSTGRSARSSAPTSSRPARWVGPDRLRFDFSHHAAVTPDELDEVETLANTEIITDAPVRHYETTKEHAEQLGAIAFFGDKYGDLVRVLEAGDHSLELCGGTHVHALGFIGPIKIVAETSIGANLRRIEALTGDGALEHIRHEEHVLRTAADALKAKPDELPLRVERMRDEIRALRAELDTQRSRQAAGEATTLAATAVDRVVVERRDGQSPNERQQLALAVRDALDSGIVALVGVGDDPAKAGLIVAVTPDLVQRGVDASQIAGPAAKLLGGGAGKKARHLRRRWHEPRRRRRGPRDARPSGQGRRRPRRRHLTRTVGRVLGVDLGTRRIGLAVSDPTATVAEPHAILERSGDPDRDREAIVATAHEVGATRIVVGYPRSLSGRDGPAARAAASETEALRATAGPTLPVELHDERFSTTLAHQAVAAGGARRKARRRPVDAVAAAVILQSYLESLR